MTKLAAPVAVAALFAGFAPASAAQDQSQTVGQKISEIIVFGNDPCPRSTDDEVVVCSRVPESYRYRMPEAYRPGGTYQQRQAWANKAKVLERVGRSGIQSCSPVGPAGYTGCLDQMISSAREESTEEYRAGTAPRQ